MLRRLLRTLSLVIGVGGLSLFAIFGFPENIPFAPHWLMILVGVLFILYGLGGNGLVAKIPYVSFTAESIAKPPFPPGSD